MSGAKAEKRRLDLLLVERGLSPSREKAQALILAGAVSVGASRAGRASELVPVDAEITCSAGSPYVSRGGQKLAHALDAFGVDPSGRVALDAGASTGGFTDVLLQRGARRVYAVDVGYGQLAWSLRNDPRVVVMERTNIRTVEGLPERPELVTADLSFISISLVLERLVHLSEPDAEYVLLVKPQFEAGKGQVGKGGVVRDPAVHRRVLESVLERARGLELRVGGLTASPILGPAGNVEFLLWLRSGGGNGEAEGAAPAGDGIVDEALRQAAAVAGKQVEG